MHARNVHVSRQADVVSVRQVVKELAKELGFDDCSQDELGIVVSELSTNLIKHADKGILSIKPFSQGGKHGIMIIADDDGPGFDFESAIADGFSTTKTLGCGLGAVHRLSDGVEYSRKHPGGTGSHIICKKWLKHKSAASSTRPLDIGIMTRPKNGQTVNGDLYVVKHQDNLSLLSVIDGVGHGVLANRAAATAKHYVESHSDLPLHDLFLGVDRACRSTNGVVMALVMIDWNNMHLSFASVGNIEAKIVNHQEKFDLIVRRGILGRNAPSPYISNGHWRSELGLVLHSDGISSRWHWDDYAHHRDKPAQFIAEQMFRDLHKGNDDATLVFVKSA